MTADPKPERLYTEEEVRTLMSRAIERQEADRRRHASPEAGLTIEEIHRIAAEVGVAPAYVTAAAADLARLAPEEKAGLLGGPLRVEMERTVPGTLTPETMTALVEEIRRTFRNHRGYVETIGSTLEWCTDPQSGEDIRFSARMDGDQLTLGLSQSFAGWAVLWYLLPLFPFIFSVLFFLAKQDVVAGLAALTLTLALALAARFGLTKSVRRRKKKLQGLMDRAEAAVARTSGAPAGAVQQTASTVPLPETPGEEEPVGEAAARARLRTRG